MSEIQKLKDRLCDPDRKLVSFGVTWGPEAWKLTPEERAGAINKMLDTAGSRLDFNDSNRPPVTGMRKRSLNSSRLPW